MRRALPWPPNKLFNKLANLATPEYEIHCFQIPYYTFQDSNLREDFLATCGFAHAVVFNDQDQIARMIK